MGIYINSGKFPNIYTTESYLVEPNNQTDYKLNYLEELLKNQTEANNKLHISLTKFQRSQNNWNENHLQKWGNLNQQFSTLKKFQQEQQLMDEQLSERLKQIEVKQAAIGENLTDTSQFHLKIEEQVSSFNSRQMEMNKSMIKLGEKSNEMVSRQEKASQDHQTVKKKMEQLLNKTKEFENQQLTLQEAVTNSQQHQVDVIEKINSFHSVQDELIKRIENLYIENQGMATILKELELMNTTVMKQNDEMVQVTSKIEDNLDGQGQLYRKIAHQITTLEETQKNFLNRVDQHEGLMEKMLLQLEHLKSIIFERTNEIEVKVEKFYETTNY